jgi:S-adenosylmethionine hydrolase
VIDVTHDVPPQDVQTAAVVLAQAIDYLPVAVHVGVVDPGVGTERRGIAVSGRHGIFVGPDNGLLTWAFPPDDVTGAWELANDELFLRPVSRTFHGRDVFMPVAAYLCKGVEPATLGPELDPAGLTRLPTPYRAVADGVLEAEAQLIDGFGNVQLAARRRDLEDAGLAGTFADVPEGELLVYEGSAGYLVVAVHGGSAMADLDCSPGQRIRLTRRA